MPLRRSALALLALAAAIPPAASAAPAPPPPTYECLVDCEIPVLTFRHYAFTADGGVVAVVRYSGENVSLAGVEGVAASTLPSTRVDDVLRTLRVRLEPAFVRGLRASGPAVVPLPLLASRVYGWASTTEPPPAGQPVVLAAQIYAIGNADLLLPVPPQPVAPTVTTTTARLKRSRGGLVFVVRTDGAPGTIRLARSSGPATPARRRMAMRLRPAAVRLALIRGGLRVGLVSERPGAERRIFRVDLAAPRPEPAPAPRPAAPAPSTGTSGGPPPGSSGNCDPNYTPCIPNVPYDLDCDDIGITVQVVGVDRHGFDGDDDGVGCEA